LPYGFLSKQDNGFECSVKLKHHYLKWSWLSLIQRRTVTWQPNKSLVNNKCEKGIKQKRSRGELS